LCKMVFTRTRCDHCSRVAILVVVQDCHKRYLVRLRSVLLIPAFLDNGRQGLEDQLPSSTQSRLPQII